MRRDVFCSEHDSIPRTAGLLFYDSQTKDVSQQNGACEFIVDRA